ncbi:MMPL family transporter [Caldibacillus thermoamylovorans]|uniref:MMPL family transporter n=1 Tax=Caldibacillus thermoamylovorans TaxID=35841 RepID=UPI001D08B27E|nr:MMPL family transporter [Caldibacillus thermoamylovorans]MCB5934634.1 MMPL family transporter [Bacillus sp. DFI.2.34]MCB7078102.1 MMPL family transporter [Caldibacillus thermoamylovorans]
MKGIIKAKWLIVVAWIVAAVILFFTAPNMADLVREKGQLDVPDGYSSKEAQKILNEINKQKGAENTTSVALVFHNKDGLTEKDIEQAKKAVKQLEDKKEQLGITNILTHFNQEELKDQLVSKDGKAILVSLSVELKDRTAHELSDDLYNAIDNIKLEHYYTGNLFVNEDVILTSEAGLKKTETITVVFILIVLIAVFRSIVTPFIPLLTVGISYLASQSIVAFLVEYLNFPLSNFTQIFLVAVLFGIGTDYSILLLSRFKEELSARENLTDAIVETYRHAGKTVLFSGIAVLIGFAVIGFSQFKLYQSAAAVAVGIVVLLAALFTIVPFFMAVLGKKLFWPLKGSLEHKPSRLWTFAGRISFARPLVSLLIVAVITIPFIVTYNGGLSYNSMDEIGEGYSSVKGFDIIKDRFGPGQAMPTTVVIKNDEEMDQTEYMSIIENISGELEKVDGVDTVRSLTRPTGEKLDDLSVASQAEVLKDGINEGNDGIKQIRDGLDEANSKLASSSPQITEAKDGISALVSGTKELQTGIGQLQTGLQQIEAGIRQGSTGAGEAKAGLEEIKKNAEQMLAGYKQLAQGYSEVQTNLSMIQTKYKDIENGLVGLNSQLANLQQAFDFLEYYLNSRPESDPLKKNAVESFKGIKVYYTALQQNLPAMANGITELNKGLGAITEGLKTANTNLAKLNNGQERLMSGLQKLIDGIGALENGLDSAADGQGTIIAKLPAVSSGLGEVNSGQQQLLDGFSQLGGQFGQLTDGLGQSVNGLTQIHDGFTEAEGFLSELAESKEDTGIFIPDEILEDKQFAQVLDTYLSPDRKIAKIDVIFSENPYSTEAINQVGELEAAVERAVKDTKLENAKVKVAGVTSMNHDLGTMSDQDFSRTVVFMLVGIFIVLVILFRSLIMPIYIVASLLLTYFTTMGITEAIFVNLLGYEGLTWAVPFFSFVILMALGVDYSIFLMGRFNEYRGEPVDKAMILAMGSMGSVIISAVIILGGTFAAMLPSGVLSLLQIATVVISGLVLYSVVMLPLFIPVVVKIFGKANWWPFVGGGK